MTRAQFIGREPDKTIELISTKEELPPGELSLEDEKLVAEVTHAIDDYFESRYSSGNINEQDNQKNKSRLNEFWTPWLKNTLARFRALHKKQSNPIKRIKVYLLVCGVKIIEAIEADTSILEMPKAETKPITLIIEKLANDLSNLQKNFYDFTNSNSSADHKNYADKFRKAYAKALETIPYESKDQKYSAKREGK